MFYRTTIDSVGDGFAIDVNGNYLYFIGYLPVKQGDAVFTDGKFIFGNAPPKGGSISFDEPSGIPILTKFGLRGYYTKNGSYKKFNIAGDNWIVNDKKKYAHDGGDDNIIDAEVSTDGQLLTVEKDMITSSTTEIDSIYKFYVYTSPYSSSRKPMYSFSLENININLGLDETLRIPNFETAGYVSHDISFAEAHFARFDDSVLKDTTLNIKKGGISFDTIYLSRLLQSLEQDTMQYINFIVVDNVSPEDHIKSRAILQNFKLLPDGNWETLILSEIWAERGFTYTRQVITQGHVNITRTVNTSADGDEEFTNVSISQMPEIVSYNAYSSSMVHSKFLLKVSSNGTKSILFKTIQAFPLKIYASHIELGANSTLSAPNATIISTNQNNMSMWIIDEAQLDVLHAPSFELEFPDGLFMPEIHDGVPSYESYRARINSDWIKEYTEFVYYYTSTLLFYDSTEMSNAPDYDNPYVDITQNFSYPIQDGFVAKLKNVDADINSWVLDSIIAPDNTVVLSSPQQYIANTHTWNMAIATLTNGYLFSIHNNTFYSIDDNGNLHFIDYEPKNFRLRELKKIRKAKK